MQTIIICDYLTSDYLVEKTKNILKLKKEIAIDTITNQQDFDSYNFKKNKPQFIFILVELYWSDKDWEGYDIAIKLLEDNCLPDESVTLKFLSFYGRDKLFTKLQGIPNFFVRAFEHFELPYLDELNLTQIYPKTWEYFKKYALTNSGILDQIEHDYRRIIDSNNLINHQLLNDILARIAAIKSILATETIQFAKDIQNTNVAKVSKTQITELHVLLRKDLKNNQKTSDDRLTGLKDKKKYRILLVEDDNDTRNKIRVYLSDYFEVIDFESGIEAKEELIKGGILYSAIICDLELLEKNQMFYQPVQGIEILDYVRKNNPHIVRRIVTGKPRRAVKEQSSDMTNRQIILKQQIETFGEDDILGDFVINLIEDIKKQSFLRIIEGPNTAFWSILTKSGNDGGGFKMYYQNLKLTDEAKLNEIWSRVRNTVKEINDGENIDISCKFMKTERFGNYLENEKDENAKLILLERILTHRLIMINQYANGDEVDYSAYRQLDVFQKEKPYSDHAIYFIFVGFSGLEHERISNQKGGYFFKIGYNRLFIEEINWLKNNKTNRLEDFFLNFEELCITINLILDAIADNKTSFRKVYKTFNNQIDISEKIVVETLKNLSEDDFFKRPSKTRDFIGEVMGEYFNNEEMEYSKLSFDLQSLFEKALDNVIAIK